MPICIACAVKNVVSGGFAGKTILDVGSGIGESAVAFGKEAMLISLDLDHESLTKGLRKKIIRKGYAVRADANRLPFRKGSFDIVYSQYFFHTIRNKRKILSQMKCAVKSSGIVIVSDMCAVDAETQAFFDRYHNMEEFCGHISVCGKLDCLIEKTGLRVKKREICFVKEKMSKKNQKRFLQALEGNSRLAELLHMKKRENNIYLDFPVEIFGSTL